MYICVCVLCVLVEKNCIAFVPLYAGMPCALPPPPSPFSCLLFHPRLLSADELWRAQNSAIKRSDKCGVHTDTECECVEHYCSYRCLRADSSNHKSLHNTVKVKDNHELAFVLNRAWWKKQVPMLFGKLSIHYSCDEMLMTGCVHASYSTKTLFQLPPIIYLYMPSCVMMSTTTRTGTLCSSVHTVATHRILQRYLFIPRIRKILYTVAKIRHQEKGLFFFIILLLHSGVISERSSSLAANSLYTFTFASVLLLRLP